MTTFITTLPDDLMKMLSDRAASLKLSKDELIERALQIYLDQLSKAEYIKSYKNAEDDEDILSMAEEGIEEYFEHLNV